MQGRTLGRGPVRDALRITGTGQAHRGHRALIASVLFETGVRLSVGACCFVRVSSMLFQTTRSEQMFAPERGASATRLPGEDARVLRGDAHPTSGCPEAGPQLQQEGGLRFKTKHALQVCWLSPNKVAQS